MSNYSGVEGGLPPLPLVPGGDDASLGLGDTSSESASMGLRSASAEGAALSSSSSEVASDDWANALEILRRKVDQEMPSYFSNEELDALNRALAAANGRHSNRTTQAALHHAQKLEHMLSELTEIPRYRQQVLQAERTVSARKEEYQVAATAANLYSRYKVANESSYDYAVYIERSRAAQAAYASAVASLHDKQESLEIAQDLAAMTYAQMTAHFRRHGIRVPEFGENFHEHAAG
jgi:hypothetical protein